MSFDKSQAIESIVQSIQAGDQDLRERFLEDSMPLIRQMIRRSIRFSRADSQDALSIALEMFNRAIDRYDRSTGVPFRSFAKLVIRNRLLDWSGQCQRQARALNFSDCETVDGLPFEERLADPKSGVAVEDLETEESLAVLEGSLETFGFSLDSMVERFPVQRPTRLFCIRAGRLITDDSQMMQTVLRTRRLPVAELARELNVPVKTVDRNRANIIFVALLLNSDLNIIQYYIAAFEKEAENE